jgi:hypothetical protein
MVDLAREPEPRPGAIHLGIERDPGLAHGEPRARLDAHHARVAVLRDAAVEEERERRAVAALVGDAEARASREAVVGTPLERGVERHVLVAGEEPHGRELRPARAVDERERVEPREQRVAAHDVDVGELELGQAPRGEQEGFHELLRRGAHLGRGGASALFIRTRFARALGLGGQRDPGAAQDQARDARLEAAEPGRERSLGAIGAEHNDVGPAVAGGRPMAERDPAQHHGGGPLEREPVPRRLEPARAGERLHTGAEPGGDEQWHDDRGDEQERRGDQRPAERAR